MPPISPQMMNGNSDEQQLRRLYRSLDEQGRKSLMDFAEFLSTRDQAEAEPLPEPLQIPRPESESVVKAIKRLSEAYFMLDKDHMINDTSALMAQHIMQGRPADEVIDELESVFKHHYQKRVDEQG